MTTSPWVIGTRLALPFATTLGATFTELPLVQFDSAWTAGTHIDGWRTETAEGVKVDDVVVAIWPASFESALLKDQELDTWVATMELPFALWFAALAVGSERCADGGQVIAVVDRPDPQDTAGWANQAAVADAVEIMSRSIALIHQGRGVRVTLITTPARLAPTERARSVGGPEGLDSEPHVRGSVDEIFAAVSLLLINRGRGVTPSVIHLGGNR